MNPADAVSLKEYINARLDSYIHAHTNIHDLLATYVERTARELSVRLEGMNEFRRQLDAQAALFITRDMLDGVNRVLVVEVRRVEDSLGLKIDGLEARASTRTKSLEDRVKMLEESQKVLLGQIAALVGAATVVNIIIALVFKFFPL